MPSKSKSSAQAGNGLLVVAFIKFAHAIFLLALTFGAISLFHKDVEQHAEHWVDALRIDPDNRYIAAALAKLNLVHTRELKQLTFLTLFYAALFATEGVGLALRKRWAEYLTIVATGLFIPLEIYEICRGPNLLKVTVLLMNLIVVGYLVQVVRLRTARG